jgi:hypothetical protein
MRSSQVRLLRKSSAGATGAALVALGLVALAWGPARADVGSPRRTLSLLTVGPTLEMGLDASLRFGGEIALAQYSGGWALGGALGFVSGRLYLEAQPALVLGDRRNLVLGLNPGVVIDVTGELPRYGGQATVWANYVHASASRWTSPIFPFVRAQVVIGMGVVFSGGIMLKLPVPIS